MVAALGDVKRPARRRRINRLFEKCRIQTVVVADQLCESLTRTPDEGVDGDKITVGKW